MSAVLFTAVASFTGLSALALLLATDIVRSAVWLLFTLVGVSLTYFLLGADFVGAAQLIIYVGGTLVLVVFGVMLTAAGPALRMKSKPAELASAVLVALALFALLAVAAVELGKNRPTPPEPPGVTAGPLGVAFLTKYLLPFEVVSVHLLVVLVGAAYLAAPSAAPDRGASVVTGDIGLTPFLCLGAFLFACGLACVATKRNAVAVLMGVELILNGAGVNFIACSRYIPEFRVEGQVFAVMVIVLAAGEAAVALAIILNFYNNRATVDVDRADELKG